MRELSLRALCPRSDTLPVGRAGVAVLVPRSHMKPLRPQPRVLVSKREAAASLGMSVRHFERHVQPQLRRVRSGQLTLYHLRDLERWAEDEATVAGRAA